MTLGKMPFRFGSRDDARPFIGNDRQMLTDALHGKHYADALAGRVFYQQNTPLGLAIPIYTGTAIAGGMPVWNPPGSGVNVELISVALARASGTSDFGAIGLMARKVNSLATGELMTAIADTVPTNALLFGGNGSKVKSSNAGTCTVAAGAAADFVRTLFSMNLEADTGTAHAALLAEWDAHGTVIVPPGTLIYLAATKASVALFSTTVCWKEIPL